MSVARRRHSQIVFGETDNFDEPFAVVATVNSFGSFTENVGFHAKFLQKGLSRRATKTPPSPVRLTFQVEICVHVDLVVVPSGVCVCDTRFTNKFSRFSFPNCIKAATSSGNAQQQANSAQASTGDDEATSVPTGNGDLQQLHAPTLQVSGPHSHITSHSSVTFHQAAHPKVIVCGVYCLQPFPTHYHYSYMNNLLTNDGGQGSVEGEGGRGTNEK